MKVNFIMKPMERKCNEYRHLEHEDWKLFSGKLSMDVDFVILVSNL